jgi:hypothetical protein
MTPQELIEKSKTESLSTEEIQQVLEGMRGELQVLKEQNPEKYLELLRMLNEAIRDLNAGLKSIK